MAGTREKLTVIGSLVSFVLFLLFVKLSAVSTSYIVNLQNSLMKSFIIDTAGQSTLSALSTVLGGFASIFLALVFLTLSLAFACAYGYFGTKPKTIRLIAAVEAVLTIALFPTVAGLFIAVGVVIAVLYVVPLANTYGKELKKWPMFRVGSHSVSKAFLIIDALIAVGILLSVLSGMQYYQSTFRQDLTDTLTDIAIQSVPIQVPGVVDRDTVRPVVEEGINNSKLFGAYFRWLPVASAVGVWVILEFLRNIIFSNIAGLFTSAIIRFYSKHGS